MPYPNGRRKKTKPAADQYALPFGQGSNWESVRDRWRGLLLSMPHTRSGLTRSSWRNVVDLLRAILYIDQHGEGCWATSRKLCEESGLSAATLKRAKRNAITLGVISVERRSNTGPNGGRQSDILRVQIANLAALQGESNAIPAAQQAPEVRAHFEQVRAHIGEVRAQSELYIKEEAEDLNRNNQPPPRTHNTPREACDRDPWPAVEEELFKTGVNQANAACEAARQQGATPDDVRALIAHWRPRQAAWGDHAQAELYRRVQRATRGEPPHHGWPAYAQDASTLQARQLDNREAAKRLSLRKASEQRWQSTLRELTSAQQRIIGDEVRRRWPYLAAPGVDRNRLVSEGVLRLFDDLGEQGIAKLLERSQPRTEAPGFASARPP